MGNEQDGPVKAPGRLEDAFSGALRAQAPQTLPGASSCPGGDFVNAQGKWERKRDCGQPLATYVPKWIQEADDRLKAQGTPPLTLPPTYTAGLCVDCSRAESAGRTEMRERAKRSTGDASHKPDKW